MTLLHESGTPLVLIGYVLYPQNIDSRMWDEDFSGVPKCRCCGFRTNFSATNEKYRPIQGGRDIGVTWDGAWIASKRFREICGQYHLDGIEFHPLGTSGDKFHMLPNRFVSVDPKHSEFEYDALCEKCGYPSWFVTRGKPMVLKIIEPLPNGFWATDILLGSGNTKGPAIIVNHWTLSVLKHAEFKGSMNIEPAYAPATPELESALATYPALKPAKVKRVTKPRPQPARLDTHPFVLLLAAPAPAFECRSVSEKQRKAVIQIQHDVREAPTGDQLTSARQLLGRPGKLLFDFYRHNNGADLYRGVSTDEVGVRLFPIDQWQGETTAMKQVFASLPKGDRPEVLERAIAFGEPPGSGHHFAIVTKGKGAGSIILTNHETLSGDEFASDFNEFLKIICSDPVDLLTNQLGSYVRYRDGKTQQEWIPVEYRPDAKK